MIRSKALWRKTWLESRTRFFGALAVMMVVAGWDILDSAHGMSRFDRTPPITFAQYVAYLFQGNLQWVWVASVLLLGLGGLTREDWLGTAQFTLTLPFRRRQWMQVRATLGLLQAAILALLPVLTVPLAARVVGRSYPIWEAFKSQDFFLQPALFSFSVRSSGHRSWVENSRPSPPRVFQLCSLLQRRITFTGGFLRSGFRIST
jgi:hypothetical protein